MSLKELFELISFDLILEGIGTAFGVGLLWMAIEGMLPEIVKLLVQSMC